MLYTNHTFSKDFCQALVKNCVKSITAGQSFNLVAMPGAGVTFLVRQLEQSSPDSYVSVNSFELHDFTKTALYNQLARKLGLEATSAEQVDLQAIGETLKIRAGDHKTVLIFNRFDRLGEILDQGFYENLHFLRDISDGRLVFGLITAEPLAESSGPGMQELLGLADTTHYFTGYSPEQLREILTSSGVQPADIEPAALELAGGHHALIQILLRCQNLANALADPLPELIVRDLYLGLSPKRRSNLHAIAAGRNVQVDPFLQNIGYVVVRDGKPTVFSPLLAEYALREQRSHLPLRERRLLSLLKRNAGRLVTKQEILDTVWRETNGIASDWTLNALVYRLRRHPAFDSQRYRIESHKKQGYILYDHKMAG